VLAGLVALPFLLLAAESGKPGEAHAIAVVAATAPDEGCPSPRQVADAVAARLPGAVLPLGQAPRPAAVRLAVSADAGGALRVDMTDQGGAPLLRRVLPAARGTGGDCVALAETVALIVERYWREVGYDVPPLAAAPPPPAAPPSPAPFVEEQPPPAPSPPRVVTPIAWSLGAAAAGQVGDTGARGATALLAFTRERPIAGRRVGVRLSAGVGTGTTVPTQLGEASFRPLPVRAGAYLPIPLPFGQLEPGIGVGAEIIMVGVSAVGVGIGPRTLCPGSVCVSPGADIALGWTLTSARHVYVRLLTRAGINVPYEFLNPNREPAWSTPRTYLNIAIESGAWFP
jgi:hypothetical protein